MKHRIEEIINSIRPYIQMDGGDIEFVDYKDNIVYVKLSGDCINCSMQDMTINNGLYEVLKNEIDEIEGIVNLTTQH